MKYSFSLCLFDGWKILPPSFRNVSLKSQPLFSSFCCSYVFTTHLLHSWFFYTRCAEKLISPPADLHSSAASKESAWKGNLKKEQSGSGCMNFHQEAEKWNFKCKMPCRKEPREINIRSFVPGTYFQLLIAWNKEYYVLSAQFTDVLWKRDERQEVLKGYLDHIFTSVTRSELK